MITAQIPAIEYSMLPREYLMVLASSGSHHAQEMLAHKVLKEERVTEQSLTAAEQWASMAVSRGHQLSRLTIAQICAARAIIYGETGRDAEAIEHLAQAIAMFDDLAAAGEAYSMAALEGLLRGLQEVVTVDVKHTVLRRAKEMQAA
jgi:hypothetical protein